MRWRSFLSIWFWGTDDDRAAVEALFWMIEEYKVSIFAQEVGADGPVSAKRLKTLIGEIERMV